MADAFLDFGAPGGNFTDTTTELSLATEFASAQAVPCHSIRIRIPASLPSAPSPAFVSLWNVLDLVTPLQVGAFEWATQTPNTWVQVPLDAPEMLDPDETYFAVYQTFEHWAGTVGFTFPHTTGILTATSPNGHLRLGYGPPNLVSGASACFLVSPVVTVPDEIEGTLVAAGPAAQAAMAGTSRNPATMLATGPAATASMILTDGSELIIPGRLTVRDDGSEARVRETSSGLKIREV